RGLCSRVRLRCRPGTLMVPGGCRESSRPGEVELVAPRTRVRSRARPRRPGLRRLVPRASVVLAAAGAVALVAGAYAAALETSVFAVHRLVLVGGSARVQDELR